MLGEDKLDRSILVGAKPRVGSGSGFGGPGGGSGSPGGGFLLSSLSNGFASTLLLSWKRPPGPPKP